MLGGLGSHHMDLSPHLNTVVQGIDGVSTMVLAAVALKFALVDRVAAGDIRAGS